MKQSDSDIAASKPPSFPRLSVIMPAYNEEDAIEDAVRDVQEHVLSCVPEAELIVVDDGSRDRTGAILDRLAARDRRICVVHKANGGHGPALRSGLDVAQGAYLFLIDSDRQIVLDDFAGHWRAVQEHDALFGIRKRRHDPAARLILTRIVRASLRLLFGVPLYDANVPYKIVRREAWERARPLIPPDTLAPSLFLAVVLARSGASIVKTEITHRIRETGTVTLRYWKLFKFCGRAFRQLLVLRAGLAGPRDPARAEGAAR